MIRKVIDAISTFGAVAGFLVMIGVVLLQVLSRYVLPFSVHWTEEAARFSFLYTVAFASGLAIREEAFVNVDLVPIALKGRSRTVLALFIDGVTLVFLVVLFRYSLQLVSIGARQTSASLRIPVSFVFFITTIISVCMAYYTLSDLVRIVRTGRVHHAGSERLAGDAVLPDDEPRSQQGSQGSVE